MKYVIEANEQKTKRALVGAVFSVVKSLHLSHFLSLKECRKISRTMAKKHLLSLFQPALLITYLFKNRMRPKELEEETLQQCLSANFTKKKEKSPNQSLVSRDDTYRYKELEYPIKQSTHCVVVCRVPVSALAQDI